ncbi:hypothetical protein D6D10_07973 [Aureobasidium pullulans]|uniref:Rhodopsin domain-containing protein n=1 Tax=Aureobasidium pullulans TaxID=5580 RepID=A0A4S9EFL2_AURPU|nr:hypothetical protein D6D10_07973 [Aureobasidium pullulans]
MGLEGRANTMIGVSSAYLVVAWIAFSLRTVVKGYIMRSFGLDDWLMVITILIFTADSGLLIAIGRDLKDVEVATVYVTYQVFQFAFYTLGNVFLKASLAITFNRILLERWQRIVVQVCVGIHTAFGLATFFFTIFRCGSPTNFYSRYHHSMCVSWDAMQGIQYTNSVINTSADWLLTLLPIFALRAMKMNHQAKISACFILVLGCVSSVMSMPRFGFIQALGGMESKFWTNAYPVAVLSVAEVGTGIAAACLLTLRPLIRSWRERSDHSSDNLRLDAMEEAEFGEAKAVSVRSISASSVSDGTDSMHKVKSIPAPVVINATEVDITPQPSPVETFVRRRSSCRAPDDATLHEDEDAISREEVTIQRSEQRQQPEQRQQSQSPELTQRITEDSGVRPWVKPVQIETKKAARDRKRLTWNDLHAQWNNMHVSRAAYHGPVKEAPKPKRMSLKRLTMLFPNWEVEKE